MTVVIAIIVMLAAFGTALVSVSTAHQGASALDIQSARAYQAARAGIEWGIYRALAVASCAPGTSFSLPGGLSDFTVTVSCSATSHTEVAPPAVVMYAISATACNFSGGACPVASPSNPNYVERQLRASVSSN